MKKSLLSVFLQFFSVLIFAQAGVTFHVDMTFSDVFNPQTDEIYISGDFLGWAVPGTDPDAKMSPVEPGSMIYTFSWEFDEFSEVSYKYFRVIEGVATTDNGEWVGDPDRLVIITESTVIDDKWGDKPVEVIFNVDMTEADPFDPGTDEIFIAGTLANGNAMPGSIEYYRLQPIAGSLIYSIVLVLYKGEYEYKFYRITDGNPGWDHGEWEGEPMRMMTVDANTTEINRTWGIISGIYSKQKVTFNCFPNPVENTLFLNDLPEFDKIEILNISGEVIKVIYEVNVTSMKLDVADLKAGIYLLSVNTGISGQSVKFIKR